MFKFFANVYDFWILPTTIGNNLLFPEIIMKWRKATNTYIFVYLWWICKSTVDDKSNRKAKQLASAGVYKRLLYAGSSVEGQKGPDCIYMTTYSGSLQCSDKKNVTQGRTLESLQLASYRFILSGGELFLYHSFHVNYLN